MFDIFEDILTLPKISEMERTLITDTIHQVNIKRIVTKDIPIYIEKELFKYMGTMPFNELSDSLKRCVLASVLIKFNSDVPRASKYLNINRTTLFEMKKRLLGSVPKKIGRVTSMVKVCPHCGHKMKKAP